jgi:uncharacterized protein (DUF1778 family)
VVFRSKVRHDRPDRDSPSSERPASAHSSPIRILRDEKELREALDRAASFERRIVSQFTNRVARYEHQDSLD